jgi:hypothetical protein
VGAEKWLTSGPLLSARMARPGGVHGPTRLDSAHAASFLFFPFHFSFVFSFSFYF